MRFFKRRRRRKIVAQAFPAAWRETIENRVSYWKLLNEDERERVQKTVQILVAEKDWYGCNALEMNAEIQVTIAAQAAILLLGLDHDYFPNLSSILVYPDAYVAPSDDDRVAVARSGEAHSRNGPVVLSWAAVHEGARSRTDGENVVFHEFAHKLDLLDGVIDGTPPLHLPSDYETWQRVMGDEFASLQDRVERGLRTVIGDYGATNEAEFFAVSTEVFFENPRELQRRRPALYGVLQDYYRQDPADRF